MTQTVTYTWNLRLRLAARNIYNTKELASELAIRGFDLSRMQVFRILTQTPQRMSLDVFAALCDICDCTPAEIMEVHAAKKQVRKRAGSRDPHELDTITPVKANIRKPTRK